MQRRGHPSTKDQLFPYGDGADEGGHKEAGGKEVISQNTPLRIHTFYSSFRLLVTPELILCLVFSGQMRSLEAPGTLTAEKTELNGVKAEECFFITGALSHPAL